MRSIVHDMGAADAFPSLECLSHVQRLYLCGKFVYLQVPARVSWQRFSITGSAPSLVTVWACPRSWSDCAARLAWLAVLMAARR